MKLHKLHKPATMLLSIILVASLAMYYDNQVFATHNPNHKGGGGGSTTNSIPIEVCSDDSKDFTTIQSAVDAAKNGDTIIVCGGTYNEAVVIDGKNAKNLTVMVAEGEMVIVYGKGSPAFSIDGQGVTLKGFIAQSYDGVNTPEDNCIESVGNNNKIIDNIANNCKHGIYLKGQNTLVSGNEASYNENNGITTFNHKNDNNNKFIDNTIENNGAYGLYITGNNAIVSENMLRNNGNNNHNIHVWGNGYSIIDNTIEGGGTGIYAYGNTGEISDNVVKKTLRTGIKCICQNSIISNNDALDSINGQGFYVKGSDLTIDNNISDGNGNDASDHAFSLKGNNNTLDSNTLKGQNEAEGLKLTGNDNLLKTNNDIIPLPNVSGNNNVDDDGPPLWWLP